MCFCSSISLGNNFSLPLPPSTSISCQTEKKEKQGCLRLSTPTKLEKERVRVRERESKRQGEEIIRSDLEFSNSSDLFLNITENFISFCLLIRINKPINKTFYTVHEFISISCYHKVITLIITVFSVDLKCKEELNLMQKVLRLLVKVRQVEQRGTDSLLPNTQTCKVRFDKKSQNYFMNFYCRQVLTLKNQEVFKALLPNNIDKRSLNDLMTFWMDRKCHDNYIC